MFAISSLSRRRTRWAVIGLGILITLGATWAAAWYGASRWLDSRAGEALREAVGRGTVILCPGREVGGFPAALRIGCDQVVLHSADVHLETEGVKAGVSLGQPTTLTAQAVGPARIEAAGLRQPIELSWARAMLSAGAGLRGPERVGFEAHDLRATFEAGSLSLAVLKAALTPNGTSASWVRATVADLRPVLDGRAVPPLAGAASAQLSEHPARLLRSHIPPGLRISNIAVRLTSGAVQLLASGELSLRPDQLLDGKLIVQVAGIEALPALLASLPDGPRALGNGAAGAMMAVGRPITLEGQQGREIVMDIQAGVVRFGFVALGRIPAL